MAQVSFSIRGGTFEAANSREESIEDVIRMAFYQYLIEEEAKCLPLAAESPYSPQPLFVQDDFDTIKVSNQFPGRAGARRYSIEMHGSMLERIEALGGFKPIGLIGFMNNALNSYLAKDHIESSFSH